MVLHGMDTILYVPSIVDPTDMINIIESPDEVTLQHVIDTTATQRYMYDEYDESNDEAAKAYLENSLSPDLKARLELKSEDTDNAATTWMRLVLLVCDSSAKLFSRFKDDLKKLHPKTEPGEDISLYCDQARRICKKLHQSKQFDCSLILWIVKVFTTVSVEPFHAAWHNKRDTVDIDIQRCAHMTPAVALAFMLAQGNHYTQILNNGEWGPATRVKDSQRALSAMTASADLVQNTNHAANVMCHKWGKKGHYANKCKSKPNPPMLTLQPLPQPLPLPLLLPLPPKSLGTSFHIRMASLIHKCVRTRRE
jgi:hypothetical protein